VYITDLIENYPAQNAGLKIGDAFIRINDTLVVGNDLASVREKLIGIKETSIKLEIKRGNSFLTFQLNRKEVISPAVDLSFIDSKGLAYIRLNHFLRNSSKVFKNHLDSLKKIHSIEKLIIDLRQNSGGIVEESVAALSNFLPAKTEVCFLKGFHKDANYSYYTDTINGDTLLPIVLLISNQTISAGEIFAGALQDLDRATLVGERTFGKGYVQGTRYTGMGSSLYVTAARYFTPSGRCIQEKKYCSDIITISYSDTLKKYFTKNGREVKSSGGITPDIELKINDDKNIKQLFNEKDMFFYLNDVALKYQSAKDTSAFIKQESKKLIVLLTKRIDLLHHPVDAELLRLKQKMNEYFSHSEFKKEVLALEQKIIQEKKLMLKNSKSLIEHELHAQILKRIYGKSAEEKYRILKDITFTKINT
jgi:carboxyl-terminal processing protease